MRDSKALVKDAIEKAGRLAGLCEESASLLAVCKQVLYPHSATYKDIVAWEVKYLKEKEFDERDSQAGD